MRERPKVIGVGLNKTGTTTLGVCLERLGFDHLSFDRRAFRLYEEGRLDDLLQIVEQHDSFEDWPWPLIYREIDRAFPQAKFVLTVRLGAEQWYESLRRHAERTRSTRFRERVYGYAMPHGHRQEHIDFYNAHNDGVRAHFADRPEKLLVVNWERGDGWPELARFLALPMPDEPFPHANKAPGPAQQILARGRAVVRRAVGAGS